MASSSLVTFVFNTIFFCTPFTPFKRLALCDLSVLTEIVLLPVCWALYSVQPWSFSPSFSLHAVSPFGLPDITCIQLIIYFFAIGGFFKDVEKLPVHFSIGDLNDQQTAHVTEEQTKNVWAKG